MTRRYLLDTNILSDLVRHPKGRMFDRIAVVGEHRIATSIIAAAELRFGAEKLASPKLTQKVEAILDAMEILPFETPADEVYARIRASLERAGTPIGANDLLIAAQTLSLDLILVTDNEREFGHVAGLQVENWLR